MKIRVSFKIAVIFSLLLQSSLFAQEVGEEYRFLNIANGNTQRAVSTIVQDSLGFIWFGTNGVGINRYNGADLTSYKQNFNDSNSLGSSLIHKLFIDKANRLWAGTNYGLNLYNRDFDNFKEVKLYVDSLEVSNIQIRAIQEDANGNLLIGSHYHGLFKVNPKTLKGYQVPVRFSGINSLEVNSIVNSTHGDLYIGTNKGLFKYTGTIVEPVLAQYEQDDKLISHHIETLYFDNTGALWLGTFANGLFKISFDARGNYTTLRYEISDKRILAIAQAPDGKMLCGTENDGLFVIDKNDQVYKNYRHNKFDTGSIKSNSIWSLFVDTQGRIWIGYYNQGLAVYDKFYDKFKDIESLPYVNNSLHGASVTGIINDKKGNIWIGIDGGGVDVYNTASKNITHLTDPNNPIAKNLDARDIVTLFIDSKNTIWVGTWNSGIFYLPENASAFIQYNVSNTDGGLKSNRIMSFAEDSKGTIWIGTFLMGLHSYSPQTKKFTHVNDQLFTNPLASQRDVRTVLVDKKDAVWLGTTSGLYEVEQLPDGSMRAISFKEKMRQNLVNRTEVDIIVSLFEDSKGIIWAGTIGAGLCKYNPAENTFTWFTREDGLGQETIASILEDDLGNIWVGGNNGLTQFNTASKTFKNFDKQDGLLANDFNYNASFKDENGYLYFGSYEGINYLNPKNISFNDYSPQVYFTDFKLFNKSVIPNSEDAPLKKVISQTEAITLTSAQSVFTIEYAGISFTRSEKNQYAYYLEGFDEKWNYVGQSRSATYTNLPPGDYVFKVKAANNDGVWDEIPQTLNIKVLRPWWSTNTAIGAYLFALLIISFFIYNLVKQRVAEKRAIASERDRRIQEEVLNDRKLQFFTNISHEFRTPLTLILNPLEDIIDGGFSKMPKPVTDKLAIIHKNTNRLKRLIDELMDFRKLEINKFSVKASKLDAGAFVKEITSHFEEEASLKNIALSVETDEVDVNLWSDPSMLEKILFNLLSNAFKITPDSGSISVSVYRCNQKIILPLVDENEPVSALEIQVEDTGLGIKKEEVDKIFERFYQVEKMNSQYYGGTGIGLEVVKNFIDLLKGKIEVESEEGVGTKFKLFFPLGYAHFSANELFLVPQESATVPQNNMIQRDSVSELLKDSDLKSLLIVEDNAELRNYLKNELSSEYFILEASNGTEGLALASKKIPDLIITDVVMPELDGFAFCAQLKADLKTSHIPLIMLTAKAMTEDWVTGIDAGADVYLNKPFDMKILKAQLRQIILSRQVLFNKYLKDSNNVMIPENTSQLDKKFITKVLEYITTNISDENLTVENLAEELNLSRSQLYRKIKALTGNSANEFLRKIRLEKAKELIESGNASISEVCFKVGFSSPSYFTKCFKAHFGILPTELK
ncbi:two-component regulator propeller domain-containing protein [Leeuwenhoekiella sp. W20_SRS_FM14]|uniref:two-component regulator propeller domain-containing protein n=1 Tax=Leeuwenhoekiella sp. W20_SRS_FM14 TaxID=3240270 RepID=UPI003F9DFC8C